MTSTPNLPPEAEPQSSIGGAGGLQLSVWAFRVSALALVLGVVTTAAGVPGASGVLRVGLIVLMATPALRVSDLLVGYVRRRDWGTVAAMLSVLAVVAATVFVALH